MNQSQCSFPLVVIGFVLKFSLTLPADPFFCRTRERLCVNRVRSVHFARKKAQEVVKCPPARITCGVCMHVLVYSFAGWSVFC